MKKIQNIKMLFGLCRDKVVAIMMICVALGFISWFWYGKSMYCPKCHTYLYYDNYIPGYQTSTWNGYECLNCGQKVSFKTADWLYPWEKKPVIKGKIRE